MNKRITPAAALITAAGLIIATPASAEQAPDAAQEQTMAQDRDLTNRLIDMSGRIQSINQELSNQRAAIGQLKAELAAQGEESEEFRRDLLKELKVLRRQNQSMLDSFSENLINLKGGNSEIKPLRNYDLQSPDGKMYFGEDEYVYIKEADATIDARIDTGAAVSSIAASDITEFERQGKKWYRFNIEANDHSISVEAPYVRTSTIRQVSKESTTERVVVLLTVKVGDYSTQSEFTLADRSRLNYPLLIGRTLMQDIAVVDVSRDHIQGRNKDTFLILQRDQYLENMKKGIDLNAEYKAKRESKAGQVAYPSSSYGANLGTNPENALPAVRQARKDVLEEKAGGTGGQDAKGEGEAKAKTDAKSDAKSDAKAKTDAKSDAKSDAKAKTDAKDDAKSDAK